MRHLDDWLTLLPIEGRARRVVAELLSVPSHVALQALIRGSLLRVGADGGCVGRKHAVQLLMEVGLEILRLRLGLRVRERRRGKRRWQTMRLRFLLDVVMLLMLLLLEGVLCCVSIQWGVGP